MRSIFINEISRIRLNQEAVWQSDEKATEAHPSRWNLKMLVVIVIFLIDQQNQCLKQILWYSNTMRSGLLPALSNNNTPTITAGIWKRKENV